jgi:hypothetical protein
MVCIESQIEKMHNLPEKSIVSKIVSRSYSQDFQRGSKCVIQYTHAPIKYFRVMGSPNSKLPIELMATRLLRSNVGVSYKIVAPIESNCSMSFHHFIPVTFWACTHTTEFARVPTMRIERESQYSGRANTAAASHT